VKTGDRIKVVYLAGNGRSGSTLLDLVLGRIDGCFSLGELIWIWSRGYKENQLCGCGAPFHECEFWSRVTRTAFAGANGMALADLARLRKRVVRRRYIPRMVSGGGGTPYRDSLDRYTETLGLLYRAIRDESGSNVLIDSSKSPVYLYALNRVPDVELHVVHLVRDSRAVAHSWSRKKIRPEIHWEQRYMPRYSLRKSARDWTRNNLAAELYRYVGRRYVRLRYEDFVRQPQATLRPVLSGLGLAPDAVDFIGEDRRLSTHVTHTVAGNPMRLGRRDVVIREDRKWQEEMSRSARCWVTLLTLPLLMNYGYLRAHRRS
jgi:hypothetical protein